MPAVQGTLTLKIFGNTGRVVASGTETLLANQSKGISFDNVVPGAGGTVGDPTAIEFHASVEIPPRPNNRTTCSRQERELQAACLERRAEFASSLELIDGKREDRDRPPRRLHPTDRLSPGMAE